MSVNPKRVHGELLKAFQLLGNKYGVHAVFEDFLAMYAYAISNSVDAYHYKKREADYMRIVKKYSREEIEQIVALGGHLIMELESQSGYPQDILGPLFHELNLHNEYAGQFFSPQNICDAMAQMAIGTDKLNNGKAYITVMEPACGSGAMVLAAAKALQAQGRNYQQEMIAVCIDIDFKCVCMTYIQLALHGIPAIIIHGNTLTTEEHSRWYTPMYFIGEWYWKEPRLGITDVLKPEVEAYRMASSSMYAALRKIHCNTEAADIRAAPLQVESEENQPVAVPESIEKEEQPRLMVEKKKRKKKNQVEQLSLFGLAAEDESSIKIAGEIYE